MKYTVAISGEKNCTQQSTWMEMVLEYGGNAAVALEDGSSTAALGGGIGWQLKIAVVTLSSGGGRRPCNDSFGIIVVEAESLLHDVGISVGEVGKRGRIQCKGRTPEAMARR
jgi:hypothetical protein